MYLLFANDNQAIKSIKNTKKCGKVALFFAHSETKSSAFYNFFWLKAKPGESKNDPSRRVFCEFSGFILKVYFIVFLKFLETVFYTKILCDCLIRGSLRRCSLKKDILKSFSKLTEKHLCQSLFSNTKKRL